MGEQFVGQELRSSHNETLFYWSREKRGSSAEIDGRQVIIFLCIIELLTKTGHSI
jgi:hypothetical protein